MPSLPQARAACAAPPGVLADDEAVGHVADARRPPRRRAPPGPARVPATLIAVSSGGGRSSTSSRKPVRCRARSSSERHGGRDVDEPEERRAQLRVRATASSIALASSARSGWRAARRGTPSASAWPMRPISGSSACPPGARAAMASERTLPRCRPGPRPDAPLRGRGRAPVSGWRPTARARSRCSARRRRPSTSRATTTRSFASTASTGNAGTSTRCTSTATRPGPSRTPSTRPAGSAQPKEGRSGGVRLLPRRCPQRSAPQPAQGRGPRGPRDRRAARRWPSGCSTEPFDDWPDLLLMLGDQVYADETSPRDARSSSRRRAPPTEPAARRARTSRSTPTCTASPGRERPIRWLLSTVSSAMIFDDHDVHDDWNISARPGSSRCGPAGWWDEHIIGALMSYWVYQHIGNLARATSPTTRCSARVNEADDAGPILREFAMKADREPDGTRWSYCRDLGDTRLVVIDSRAGPRARPRERARCSTKPSGSGWRRRPPAASTTCCSPPRFPGC